jgi:hypothetical protein
MTQMLAFLNSTATGGWLRVTAKGCLLTCLVLICVSIVNNVTNLRLQLAVDDANAEIVHFLAELPPNTRVAVNIPQNSEYLFELGLHLSSMKMRPDLMLEPCQGSACLPGEGKHSFYLVMPELDNQLLPSVRIGVDKSTVTARNHALTRVFGAQTQAVYKTERKIQLLDFGFHRFICLLAPGAGGFVVAIQGTLSKRESAPMGGRYFALAGALLPGLPRLAHDSLRKEPLNQTVSFPV